MRAQTCVACTLVNQESVWRSHLGVKCKEAAHRVAGAKWMAFVGPIRAAFGRLLTPSSRLASISWRVVRFCQSAASSYRFVSDGRMQRR